MRTNVYATMMVMCAGVALLVSAGCGVAPRGEALAMDTDELQVSGPAERVVEAIPMRSEDLVDVAAMETMLNAACPAVQTCHGFDSCASWSTTISCGSPACGAGCVRCIQVKPCALSRSTNGRRIGPRVSACA